MSTIHTRTHIGTDGILRLQLPVDVANADVDVTVVVEPSKKPKAMSREEWLRFIRDTAGSIDDPTFVRHEQGTFEIRDELP